jgi:hypothetical protein
MKKLFKYKENILRKKYRKNVESEEFLDTLNELLSQIEPDSSAILKPGFPIIFILGLHRSGTTLVNQLIAHCFDIGYINNLIARFWRAPITGIKLSNIVLDEHKNIDFRSFYGKTQDISGPHEFSYFWHHWFRMENMPPYDPKSATEIIDWKGFQTTLRLMVKEFGKPLVLKAPDVSYHFGEVSELLKESVFIHMVRDLEDVCVSLRDARYRYFGNYNTWLGSYPIEYESIKNLDHVEQIARQVYHLDELTRKEIKKNPERVITVHLQNLCENPMSVMNDVKKKVAEYCRFELCLEHRVEDRFEFSSYQGNKIYNDFRTILKRIRNTENM